ncbi:MAG: AAA family ATPase [Clostridia bacterium]|nr:AAA family ATPase [Clostridia bacterium]
MGTGIIVCGLNGAGKSTLGKALAEKLQYHFIDNEDLFFPKDNPTYLYASPRTKTEAEALLLQEIANHDHFVFASVIGNYSDAVINCFRYAIRIEVPKEIRMQRVQNRSYQKFGNRMLPGGDLYEQESRFFDMVHQRKEEMVDHWIAKLQCPILCVDGTKKIEENVKLVAKKLDAANVF